jgi:demethylmenaquinone methyltransferase/2-methoxy-6-polyprenyl-1,4-benzoquinol methylase
MENLKPYNNIENKKKQIKNMFNNIADEYDFLNQLISFRMD